MALVLYEKIESSFAKIVLNDAGNLNAMGEDMAVEFTRLVEKIRQEPIKPRVIILTGAGRAFSAGGRLDMLEKKRALPQEENRVRMLHFYHSFLSMHSLGIPLIAAINGPAVGAGLCLAAACDVRIAVPSAKLGFTFTRLGLHPGMGATYFLPRIIGLGAASELMLTARVIDSVEAQRLGLVSRVVEPGELFNEALKVAKEIELCGPESVRMLLESIRGEQRNLEDSLIREARCQSVSYASSEFAEGVRAAIEKRAAKF